MASPMYDVILVQPYPFADHPSFPEGILKRALEAAGFSVGVIETPYWQERGVLHAPWGGRPFFSRWCPGPLDSVVLNYTAGRRRRREDLYQFDGQAFFSGRPPGHQVQDQARPHPDRFLQPAARGVPRRAAGHRRRRGVPALLRPLRFPGGQGAPLRAARFPRRYPGQRQRRKAGRGHRPAAAAGRAGAGDRHPRHGQGLGAAAG